MKKVLFTLAVALITMAVRAQNTAFKVHDSGQISLQSGSTTNGVQFQPSGFASFEPAITRAYGRMEQAKIRELTSKCWIVRNDLNMVPFGDMFYVTGNGSVYYYYLYSIQNPPGRNGKSRGFEPIGNASELIARMDGYYTESDEFAGNPEELIDNEYVAPEAIEGLVRDMQKDRSVVMDAEQVEIVLPEAVRHTAEGNVGINYNALVAVLVEAFKEQQARIAQLEEILRENGLSK